MWLEQTRYNDLFTVCLFGKVGCHHSYRFIISIKNKTRMYWNAATAL